jgi:hypothetical protein
MRYQNLRLPMLLHVLHHTPTAHRRTHAHTNTPTQPKSRLHTQKSPLSESHTAPHSHTVYAAAQSQRPNCQVPFDINTSKGIIVKRTRFCFQNEKLLFHFHSSEFTPGLLDPGYSNTSNYHESRCERRLFRIATSCSRCCRVGNGIRTGTRTVVLAE